MDEKFPFMMGIEFGAITSGLSIAHMSHSLSIYSMKSRPLTGNKFCEQLPTSILYKGGNVNEGICGIQESKHLNDPISPGDIYIKNIKEIAYGYDNLAVEGLTSQKVVADYLRFLHDVAVEELKNISDSLTGEQKRKKSKVSFQISKKHEELFKRFKVEDTRYCIACPREQISFIQQCFIEAGIIKDKNELEQRLDCVTESEATAYNLLAWDRKHSKIKSSKSYLVCDLGHTSLGISEIQADTTESLSEVKFVNEYLGEGSMLLDSAFSRLIQERKLPTSDEKVNEEVIAKWNREFASDIKHKYHEKQMKDSKDNSNDVQKKDTRGSFNGLITDSDLNEHVFEPVTSKFVENIQSSIRKGEELNGISYDKIYFTGRYAYDSCFLDEVNAKLGEDKSEKHKKGRVATIWYEIIDSVSRGAVSYAMRKRMKKVQIPYFEVEEGPLDIMDTPIELPVAGKNDFIVGIDFGTSSSSVSYAYGTEGPIKTYEWSHFYRSSRSTKKRCPSSVLYRSGRFRPNRSDSIFHQRGSSYATIVENFKLLLVSNATSAHYGSASEESFETEMDKMNRFLIRERLTAKDVIKNYLGFLLRRVHDHVNKRAWPTFYVLTVPAMWNDDSKRTMVEAFEETKIMQSCDSFIVITEPEAAALNSAAFINYERKKHDDTILVYDAGGGVVESATFQRRGLDSEDITITQLCRGDSGLCGLSRLYVNCKKLIYDFYRNDLNVQLYRGFDISLSAEILMEEVKRITVDPRSEADGARGAYVQVVLPRRPDISSFPSSRVLTRPDGVRILKVGYDDIFDYVVDPMVDEMLEILDKQINRLGPENPPDRILMIGGVSNSLYSKKKIGKRFASSSIVTAYPDPLNTISAGAVFYAQRPHIICSSLVPQSYAIEVKTKFSETFDRLENRITERGDNNSMIFYSKSKLEYFFYGGIKLKKACIREYKRRVYVEYPFSAVIAIFSSDHDLETIEDKTRLRYVDIELHTKLVEVVVNMPIIPNAENKQKIPFLISLQIGKSKGVEVFVECEMKEKSKYQAYP